MFVAMVERATEGHFRDRELIKYSSAETDALDLDRHPMTRIRPKYARIIRRSIGMGIFLLDVMRWYHEYR
jgi:hypothetical protein